MLINLLLWQYAIVIKYFKPPEAGHTAGLAAGFLIVAAIIVFDVVAIVVAVAALIWLAF